MKLYLFLFIICGLILFAAIGYLIYFLCERHKETKTLEDYKKIKSDVAEQLSQTYAKKLSEEEVKLKLELGQLIGEYEEKKRSYKIEISTLEKEVFAAKEKRDAQLAEIQVELIKAVEEKSQTEAAQIQSVIQYYNDQRAEIKEQFLMFTDEMTAKRQDIQRELDKAEAKQKEIIEEYKRAERIKQDKDFYRIVLSENAQEDVKKLRKIADELHDPSVLYKLIYKTYYERPFNEMIGRVVTGRGSVGIYKITNIENGRVYIGQTKQTFKERWRTHLKRGVKAEPGTANKLYNAMWEDGVENFTFEVLAECSAAELNTKEKEYIALYHGDTWGYNSTTGNS